MVSAVWTMLAIGVLLAAVSVPGCTRVDTRPTERLLIYSDPLLANTTLARAIADQSIVNAHEHIQSAREVDKLLDVMNQLGVARTLLMGSSWFTITLNPRHGFTRYDENNAAIMAIYRADPQRFEPWPTINPLDPHKLDKVQRLVAQGARGIKLYLGHGYLDPSRGDYLFHVMAMDDPRMLPFYKWCEAHFVPLMYHVNPYKPGFAEEFIAVLTGFPDLKMVITEHRRKDAAWIETRFRAYLAMLSLDSYEVELLPGRPLNGLGLSGELLERILYRNYEALIASRPKGTEITRKITWANLRVVRTRGNDGTSIPTPPALPP
jgi:predicted TIM-barrel fold metal-dependent hydrolase